MSLINKHEKNVNLKKLINPEKAILPYCERKNETACPPFSVELHLTSFCNYNCYHCSYQNRRSKHIVVNDITIEMLINNIVSMGVMTTRIAGGLISPKRALLLAPLKGLLNNFSSTYIRFFNFKPLHVSKVI